MITDYQLKSAALRHSYTASGKGGVMVGIEQLVFGYFPLRRWRMKDIAEGALKYRNHHKYFHN